MEALRKIIRELLIQELDSEDGLKAEIEAYKKGSKEIEELQKSIEDVLKKIKAKTSEEAARQKLIIKYMSDFKINKVQADKWVATLETVKANQYPSVSYKEVYEQALSKLNEATVKVIKKIEADHLMVKAQATKPELKITDIEENVISKGVDWVISKFKGLFLAIKDYNKTVKELPKLGLKEANVVDNFYQNLKPKEAIQKAMVDYNFALKKDNTGQADKIAGNLKSHLESQKYNWKQDPYAMEILSDFLEVEESIKEANVIDEKGYYIAGWFKVQGFVWGLNEEGDEAWVGPADGDTYLIYADKQEALQKAEEAAKIPVGFDGGNNKVKWVYASGKVRDIENPEESDEEDILVQKYNGPYDNPPEKTKWVGLKGANVKVSPKTQQKGTKNSVKDDE